MHDGSRELEGFRKRIKHLTTEELIALSEVLKNRGADVAEELNVVQAEIAMHRVKNTLND